MALQEEFEKQGNYLFKYRGVIPIAFLAAGLAAFVQTQLTGRGISDPATEEWYRGGCLFMGLLGLAVRVFTVGHTPKNTSGRNTADQLADELNTTGIYSMVRHPLYLGNFLMWLGVALLTENIWFVCFFIFLYLVYYERIMFAEEQFLRRKFGDAYVQWASRIPAFIPSFRGWTPPGLPFSLKKVLKKEKNGLFTLFVVFYLFECTGNVVGKAPVFRFTWLFYVAAGTVVLYLILKILKHNTTLLDEEGR